MHKVEEILSKYDFAKRAGKPTATIAEVEEKTGFKLPEDYKFYLENYVGNEDFIGPQYFRLWDLDELLQLNEDYEIPEYLPNALGIGGNGGGECIAIEFSQGNSGRVVLTPFIDMDVENCIVIGDSFTNFFERLEEGREWFDETDA